MDTYLGRPAHSYKRGGLTGLARPLGLAVDLCDLYVPALKQQAQAFDWEVLVGMKAE